ncbi:MAG: cytidylyltransferase domain-containing protein [Rhodospirillales bacterium]
MKRLAVICARGGSKGIAGKNLRPLMGKPLIAHTVSQAVDSGVFDWVAVSSDSHQILAAGTAAGANFAIERPASMAGDAAPKVPAIRHCAREVERLTGAAADTVVDLDATSPLRNLDDIRGAVAKLEQSAAGNLVTGMPARRSPYFNLVEQRPDGTVRLAKTPETPIIRRQDVPACFDLNASIFCWKRGRLMDGGDGALNEDTILFEMPEERSIDIDTELDFAFVAFIMERREQSA